MANYDARINISADNRPAIAAINEIQNRFDRLNRAAQVDFGERVRLGGLERSLRTVNQIENAVISLNAQLRSLSAPGAGAIGDAFRVAGQRANNFFDGLARGDRFLSNSIAGLNEQSRAFATLAANINSAERRFTDYVQGAQAAQDAGLRPLFRQFEALRRLYQEGVTGMGSGIQSQQIGIPFFESLRNEIPNTTKALQTYRAELERIQSLIESGSAIDLGIQQELIRVERELLDIETQRLEVRSALRAETSAEVQASLSRMEGRTADPFSRPDEQINDLLDQRAEQYVLQQRELASLQQVLSSMEGKKYDPLNISDEQINSGLNERATQYQKQLEELTSLQQVLSSMEGKKYDPLNISDGQINQGLNERAAQYQVQRAELAALRNSLASMEGKKYDPFGISDQQINSSLDERASTYERQVRESEILQRALGDLERRRVDWTSALGINEADLAADNAARLEAEWNKLQSAADRLASNASEAAAALRAFEFQTRARDAEAYTRALLNQQRALDEYADSANTASRAASGLGYSGELPALRPAGFTNQDVRIKNLVDDQAKAIRINSELEIELDKIATFAAIDNIQREYDYEIDKIEDTLRARIKADEEFWAASKRNLDEADARAKAERDRAAKPFLEQRFGKRGSAAISEGLVGGAFPLLFGQGLGASVFGGLGGAAGGFAGGGLGFGLSLVGTGLGTAVDTLSTNIKNLATSLKEPTQALEAMKAAGLRVTPELEDTVKRIEALGFASSAQNLVLKELERQIGSRSVTQLQALNQEQKRLESEWQRLSSVIASAVLPGLIAITSVMSDFTRALNAAASIKPPQWMSDLQGRIEEATGFKRSDLSLGPLYVFTLRNLRQRAEAATAGAAGATTGLTPEQQRRQQLTAPEGILNSLSARKNAIELGKQLIDQQRAAQREQEDLDRQRYDLIESYEKSIADIRLGVSRRIQQEELSNLARQNEIYSKQGDIRLQQLKNENAIARESLRGNDLGQQLFDIVAQYGEEQLATENEIANRRRSLEAELQSAAIETEQYKADVAKQVNDLNLSTAKQIQQIQLDVARKQQDLQQNRFQLEKDIAIAQLRVEEVKARQAKADLESVYATEKDQGRRGEINKAIIAYNELLSPGAGGFAQLIKATENVSAPAQVSFAGFNVGQGVSTAGYDAVIAKGNELRLRLEELAKALDSLVAAGKFVEVNTLLKNLADQGAAEAANKSKELKYQFDLLTGAAGAIDPRLKELAKGQAKLLETTAGSKEEFKQLVPLYIQLAEQNIKAADNYQFFNSAIDDNLGQIESLKEEINNLLAGTTEYEKALQSLTQRGLSPASEEAQRLLASAQELDRLKDKIEVVNNIRDAATGLTESFRGLIDKFVEFKDAGKAVSEFSKEIGQRSFSFILDLAFKPVEENLQKQFIAVADQLGIDVRPEALKQLTELQQINVNTASINRQISTITGEGLVKFGASVDGATNVSIGGVSGLIANATNEFGIAEIVRGAVEQGVITEFQAPRVRADLNKYFEKFFPDSYYSGASGAAASQSVALPAPQSSLPSSQQVLPGSVGRGQILTPEIIRQYRAMTGQGGPDLPDSVLAQAIRGSGQAFPMDATTANPVPVQVVGPQPINVTPFDGAPAISPEGTKEAEKNLDSINEKINETTSGTKAASDKLNTTKGQWLKGLGSVVTGLATASSAVIGIVGGFQQIKQGGLANTLSGIGSILTTVGSIGMSVAGLSGFTGFGGGGGGNFSPDVVDAPIPGVNPGSFNIAAAGAMFTPNGPIEPFAKGGIVSSPTLFRFAKGGDSGDGLMGEDGAEAILPLGRTPSGDLGVKSIPYERQSGGSRLRVPYLRADAEYAGGGTDSPIRFESTVINSEEFVTRDEAEKIGRAAASRGAEIAQRRIRNNPQVRRSLGMV